MITKLAIILLFDFVVQSLANGGALNNSEFSFIDSSFNRYLQRTDPPNQSSSNCQTFDSIVTASCLKCVDKFMLPDCQSCPVGYKKVNNACVQCGPNQLFCDSIDNSEYCYQGFTKKGSDCVCDNPKYIFKYWCTNPTDLIYQAIYQDGEIIVEFSNKIYFQGAEQSAIYFPSYSNCAYLSNFQSDFLASQTIKCFINSDIPNQFQIVVKNTDLSEKWYARIPQFSSNLQIVDDQNNKFDSTSVTFQPLQRIGSNQQVYYYANDFTEKQCYFGNPIRYFQTDQASFLVNYDTFFHKQNYFGNSGPDFTAVTYSLNVQKSDLFEMINYLNSFQSYGVIPFPISLFSKEETFAKFSFVCSYPYNLISSNTVTFWSKKNLTPVCTSSLLNQLPLTNSDQTKIQISCSFLNFIGDPEAIFKIQYEAKDTSINVIVDQQVDIPLKSFPYTILIDPYTFNFNNQYTFYVKPAYNEFYGDILNFNLDVQKKPFQVTIQSTLLAQNNDPTKSITLDGFVDVPYIKDVPESQKTYIWSCFDQILQQNCADSWNVPRVYPQTNKFIINPLDFDFGGIYADTNEQKIASVTYNALASSDSLNAVYDLSYNQNVQLSQKLKFSLEYTNSEFLITSALNHYYIIVTQNQKFYSSIEQKESDVFTVIGEKIPDLYKEITSVNFYIKFFAKGNDAQGVIKSKNYYFSTPKPPFDCEFHYDQKPYVAFVDQIQISIQNCKSDTNSDLLYQFMYYNKQELEIQESDEPDEQQTKYLTKFSLESTITTYLPPGDIIFKVIVKDKNQTKIKKSQVIPVSKNSFTQNDYENFLNSQFQIASQFKTNSQFEKQLCTYGMIVECIEDFEKNTTTDPTPPVITLKDNVKVEILLLPNQVPNDLNSQSLQEFNIRNLERLYNSKNGPDQSNLMKRLDNVYDLVLQRYQVISQISPFLDEVRDTYRRKFLITLDISAKTIAEESKVTQQSVTWSNRMVDDIFKNLDSLALTAHVNELKIIKSYSFVDVSVQKVNQKVLFENYLYYQKEVFDFKKLDNSIIYNVVIQNWKDNIYSFEKGFQDLYQSYLSKAQTQEMKDILNKKYPAVYPKITLNTADKRFLQDSDQLILPSPINIQFPNLEGNQKIKCAQRIKDVWTKSSCNTITIQDGPKFKIICACSKPSYTSLVADVEALFENENLSNIFSEAGINSIFSLDNWYKYSCIYVIIGINLAMIVTLIVGVKLDKTDKVTGRQATELTQTASVNQIQLKKNKSKSRPSILDDKMVEEEIKKQIESKYKINEDNAQIEIPSSSSTPNNNNNDNKGNNHDSSIIIQSNEIINNNAKQITKATIQESQQGSRGIFGRKNSLDYPQKWLQSEPQIKLQGDTNVQILLETEINCNKDFEYKLNTQYRDNYQDCKNHEQHFYLIEEDLQKKESVKITQNEEDKITDIPQITKEEMDKLEKEMKKKQQIEKENLIRQLSYIYLSGLTIIKGTCLFHDLLQIFIIYDKKESRLYRFSLFYNQIIWLLTLNAVFGENLTIVQVLALSVISSIVFGIFKILLKFTLTKKPLKIIGFILLLGFLLFCYYSILVVMSNSQPSASNGWIINYIIALCIDIFVSGVISSAIKFYATYKLLSAFRISHFLFKFTSADSVFEMFK